MRIQLGRLGLSLSLVAAVVLMAGQLWASPNLLAGLYAKVKHPLCRFFSTPKIGNASMNILGMSGPSLLHR